MSSFLNLLFLFPLIYSKQVYIAIRENITQPCPNMRSDVIDKSSMRLSFEMVDGGEDAGDQATITDVNGQSKTISFPACYRAKLSFRMLRPIKNPYIEAFLQLGQNIPCQADGRSSVVENICANITRSNWCPQSKNEQLRHMLRNKQTCSFCHMCSENAGLETEDTRTFQKYIVNEGAQECAVDEEEQTLTFKMCTPSKDEMSERQDEEREKLQEYWNYLKQGILTAVVHVVDREEVEETRKSQCRQMCDTYENRKDVSRSYKKSLLSSIERLCSPTDNYAACVYHTVRFDINGEF